MFYRRVYGWKINLVSLRKLWLDTSFGKVCNLLIKKNELSAFNNKTDLFIFFMPATPYLSKSTPATAMNISNCKPFLTILNVSNIADHHLCIFHEPNQPWVSMTKFTTFLVALFYTLYVKTSMCVACQHCLWFDSKHVTWCFCILPWFCYFRFSYGTVDYCTWISYTLTVLFHT